MKEQLIEEIQLKMLNHLSNEQLILLRNTLQEAFSKVEVSISDVPQKADKTPVEAFISAKQIEGRSGETLKYYQSTIDGADPTLSL